MRLLSGWRWVARLGGTAAMVLFCTTAAGPQEKEDAPDPSLKPTYGDVKLTAGFADDPRVVKLTAGGPLRTKLGGVNAWVARAPDFKLHYTAGNFPLTIHVESDADTTLLINLPDGSWVANDDQAPGNLNPLLRFANPKTGRYDIWVGTFANKNAPAVLKITELK